MALAFAVTIRNAWLDAITTAAGASALLRFYNGARPATGGAATTLLAELVCNATFAPAASNGVLTLNPIANDSSANASGTATWFRIVKADGTTHVVDGNVGLSSTDITINTATFVAGGPVGQTALVISAPDPFAAPAPPAYPTFATTGVPTGTTMTPITLTGTLWRTTTDGATGFTSEVIGAQTYKVYTAKAFSGTTAYVYVDDPYVKFVNCSFTVSGQINNTSALIQHASTCNASIFVDCTFDGGAAFHNRCIQGDHGHITVLRGNFTRFGNAAVEKNDPTGLWDLDVRDSYLNEVKGWPTGDHADGIQMGDGRNFTVVHNTIWVEPFRATDGNQSDVSNSCIGLWAEGGNVTGNVLIQNNQMAGGGSIMYVEQKFAFTFQGTVLVDNNVFVRNHFPSLQGAAYNPTTGHAAVWYVLAPPGRPAALSGAGTGWTNNKWEDGITVTLAVAITST